MDAKVAVRNVPTFSQAITTSDPSPICTPVEALTFTHPAVDV